MSRTLPGFVLAGFAAVLLTRQPAAAVCGPCKAEQITPTNANALLIGGSDSAGGIGDWALTNGKVVAIIDNIDTETIPAVGGSATVDLTSSNAVETGGTLLDLGIKGKHNDQLPQSFNVGGLSLANVFLFRKGDEVPWGVPSGNNPCATVGSSNPNCPLPSSEEDCAAITVYGIMLGLCDSPSALCSTRTNPTIRVRTTYKACKANPRTLFLRTEVWNLTGSAKSIPIFDVLLWGGRGLVPFAPDKGRGFTHPILDLSNAGAIVAALTQTPFFATPGNLDPKDGVMARNKKVGGIAYGYIPGEGFDDSNGPAAGGTITQVAFGFVMQSLQSAFLTGTIFPNVSPPPLANNASRIFERRLILGERNDVASVVGDKRNPESILNQTPLASSLGTVSGKFQPASPVEGTVTFVRVGGGTFGGLGPQWALLDNAPISSVRTKSSFSKIQLPEGDYVALVSVPGQNDIVTPPFTVTAGQNTAIPPILLTKPGRLKIEVRDADSNTGIPAKVSLSPSPDMKREFAAFEFDTRSGMCSNNFATSCTNDSTCGSGNTCFRLCTNKVPVSCSSGCPAGTVCASDGKCRGHLCNADSDCDPGYLCRADTTDLKAVSFPGVQKGGGQMHVIYTDAKGKAVVDVKPGTYTVTISRGLEYTAQQVSSVTITSGATTDLGIQTIKRVVDTTGFVSADFHIHSGRSLDSSAPLEARVRSYAGEGLEVMVSTDHDINTDYAPIIKKLKMEPFVASIVGTEVTTSVPHQPFTANGWGHINAWPSIFNPNLRRSGSIEDEVVSANVIYDRLRAQSDFQCASGSKKGQPCTSNSHCGGAPCVDLGEQVVQLNHPRAGLGGVVNIGMFDNIGFNPPGAIDTCQQYPVRCSNSKCFGGTNDGTACTSHAQCTGGGLCGCDSGSIPGAANGCNQVLLDLNVVPRPTLCTTAGCGSGFENPNGTRNIDFDVMEIHNGATRGTISDLKLVRRDWLSLLNQAIEVGKNGARHFVWGTGVSDSHRIVEELPGFSRTFVKAGDLPTSGALDVKQFNQAVLDGEMTVSSGPFVTVTADNGGPPVNMGDTVGPSATSINLHIQVQAAPWIPVEEVRIIKNGCVLACFNSTTTPAVANNPSNPFEQTSANVVRFNATYTDTVTEDSYYIVEASQNLPLTGPPPLDPAVNAIAGNLLPWGFTNPIFADHDGNGEYDGITLSPGTGEPTCPALPPSCSAGAATVSSGAPSIMVATAPAEAPARSWWARLLDRLLPARAVADDRKSPRVMDDRERVRQREEELKKPGAEHLPWNRIQFPTPAPTPAPNP